MLLGDAPMNSSTAFVLPQQSRYSALMPFPRQAAEVPYQATIRALDWQTRGIFERLRDLFGWQSVLEMSQSELAKRIGCSKAKLIEVLYTLEAAQLISVQRQRLSHKRMQINRYHLLAPVCADTPARDQSVSQTENQEERKEKKASISIGIKISEKGQPQRE
jgi:DNA-directed RNA polymerase specialized sigma subunit